MALVDRTPPAPVGLSGGILRRGPSDHPSGKCDLEKWVVGRIPAFSYLRERHERRGASAPRADSTQLSYRLSQKILVWPDEFEIKK
jgi:hypothetical protein